MTIATKLLNRLPSCIAVVAEDGSIRYQNEAFAETFREEGQQWLHDASRAVGGERGWLQPFFIDGEQHTIDVERDGRIYRIDRIYSGDEDGAAVALSFEDVTKQREAEQARSDFTAQIVHDLRGPLSGIQGTLEFVLSQEGNRLDSL